MLSIDLSPWLKNGVKSLGEGGHTGAFLADLSKAFNCLNHDLLIAKLNAFGVGREPLSFSCSYVKNRENEGPKLTHHITDLGKLFFVLLKDSFWVIFHLVYTYAEAAPFRGVAIKRCSENMQQIYSETPMPKSDFNKIILQLYWNRTSAWVFSCKFPAYFQNTIYCTNAQLQNSWNN